MIRPLGHTVLEFACADYDADDVEFTVVDMHGTPYEGGSVSFESFSALKISDAYVQHTGVGALDTRTIRVKVRKLDTLLATYAPEMRAIDLLSVHIEGGELAALGGLNFERYKPRLLVVENLTNAQEYRDFMSSKGYRMWRCVGPNEIYVAS